MPYHIVQFPDGYRVVSDINGQIHSYKPLSLATAKKQLTALNIAYSKEIKGKGKDWYLSKVQSIAKKLKYSKPYYSDDKTHKFMITAPDGSIRYFGRIGYGDYHLWSEEERKGNVPIGYADMKRNVFHKSHEKIKGNWRNDPYSPNNLSLNLLW